MAQTLRVVHQRTNKDLTPPIYLKFCCNAMGAVRTTPGEPRGSRRVPGPRKKPSVTRGDTAICGGNHRGPHSSRRPARLLARRIAGPDTGALFLIRLRGFVTRGGHSPERTGNPPNGVVSYDAVVRYS